MKAYLYVLDTLADWEIGYLIAELNSRRFLDKRKDPVSLLKTGAALKTVKTMGGIPILPDILIDNIEFKRDDLLILPGSDNWDDAEHQKILNFVPDILAGGTIVAAICGATIALAKNGLLNNKKHTSNDLSWIKMTCPRYSGEALYSNQPVVVDANLITATGFAPLEFSYEVLKKINIMKPETLEAWYGLYRTREPAYFFNLMDSLK